MSCCKDDGARPAIGITLLSMVLGLAAMAAGAGDAGAGILAAGQTAALGKFLAFTRVQEATADANAVRYLVDRRDQRARHAVVLQETRRTRNIATA